MSNTETWIILTLLAGFVGYLALIIIAVSRLLRIHRKTAMDTVGAVIWLFVIFTFPFLGSLAYLLYSPRQGRG